MVKRIKSLKAVFESSSPQVILITGTPGTGKSTIMKRFSTACSGGVKCLNVSDLIKKEGLHSGYDSEFDTFIVNDRKVRRRLEQLIPELKSKSKIILIESHSCGIFERPEGLRDLITSVLVLKCTTEALYDRLEARGYASNKISENVSCEIMRVCADEAAEIFASRIPVVEMDNSSEGDSEVILKYLQDMLLV